MLDTMPPRNKRKSSKQTKRTPKVYPHKFPLWGLRLPPSYKEQIAKKAADNRRSPTEEVKIALEKYLAESGHWPP